MRKAVIEVVFDRDHVEEGVPDDFAKLHSIAETAMKNGNSKFKAILCLV